MRQSNRTKILEAAVEVVDQDGVTGVTLESVAVKAGLTKGGLMYHFPTRDALLQALHQHLARQWESSMADSAGMSAQDADATQRLAAYARVASQGAATRAEMLLILEASTTAEYAAPWTEVLTRWTPPAADALHDPVALGQFIARLAADGLWMYEALAYEALDPELRGLVAEHIAQIITGQATDRIDKIGHA